MPCETLVSTPSRCCYTILAGLLLSACSASIDPRVVSLWRHHEQAVERAILGSQKNDVFDSACLFYHELTGIEIDANIFTLGSLPGPEARADLELIRAWYRANQHRLYWDEADRTVKVRSLIETQADTVKANGG
jgi:hypothetical protein